MHFNICLTSVLSLKIAMQNFEILSPFAGGFDLLQFVLDENNLHVLSIYYSSNMPYQFHSNRWDQLFYKNAKGYPLVFFQKKKKFFFCFEWIYFNSWTFFKWIRIKKNLFWWRNSSTRALQVVDKQVKMAEAAINCDYKPN